MVSLSLGIGCIGVSEQEIKWMEKSPVLRLMEVLERDGNPGLSRAEIEATSSPTVVFEDHDTSGDGVLDEAEVRVLLGKVSPLGKPVAFLRDPRKNFPLDGMRDFRGTPLQGCERFSAYMEDALFHLRLVGGEVGELPAQLKVLVEAGDCNFREARGKEVLSGLAETWRQSGLKGIFKDMGVD